MQHSYICAHLHGTHSAHACRRQACSCAEQAVDGSGRAGCVPSACGHRPHFLGLRKSEGLFSLLVKLPFVPLMPCLLCWQNLLSCSCVCCVRFHHTNASRPLQHSLPRQCNVIGRIFWSSTGLIVGESNRFQGIIKYDLFWQCSTTGPTRSFWRRCPIPCLGRTRRSKSRPSTTRTFSGHAE